MSWLPRNHPSSQAGQRGEYQVQSVHPAAVSSLLVHTADGTVTRTLRGRWSLDSISQEEEWKEIQRI